ncbi:hypothetical protein [Chryseobacterium sp. R2A-55]|uniref:hypothetical protein n=1 Tax=Chryseobacterium sp. R2A-55 TaxID=2744445 RepID=UPI001F391936|nr:hypothetical protein [Chryseobacterium sp. R2A-55]
MEVDRNLNKEPVRNVLPVHFGKYSSDAELANLQIGARNRKSCRFFPQIFIFFN